MNEVIELLKNPEFVLKECFRILGRRGRIIITGPVRNFFMKDISPTHFSEMSITEMRDLIQKCGFKVLSHEVCGISFLYPLLENFLFKPFRLLRYILREQKKKEGVRLIDSCHRLTDKTFLKPLSCYRKHFLRIGSVQLVLAQKN